VDRGEGKWVGAESSRGRGNYSWDVKKNYPNKKP